MPPTKVSTVRPGVNDAVAAGAAVVHALHTGQGRIRVCAACGRARLLTTRRKRAIR
jgi:hypothetical protein